MFSRCKMCNRRLVTFESISRGYGSVCYKKHLEYLNELFLKRQLTIFDYKEEGVF